MTRAALLDHIIAEHRRTGRKPKRIELSAEDWRELEADVERVAKPRRCCCACHQHEVRGGAERVLTFVGVDIYVKGESE